MLNRVLIAILAALIVSSLPERWALAQDGDPQLQRGSSQMIVNTPDDVVARDGVLSLREAMMLAEGSLYLESLDSDELGQIIGVPGNTDLIKFDREVFPFFSSPSIYIGEPLPPLSNGFDTIDARFTGVTLVGRYTREPGLYVTSSKNLILGVKMVEFADDAIVIADGRDNQIRDAQLYNNGVGVYITGYLSRDNLVRRSDIENNREANIWLNYGADKNRIEDNDLQGSIAGIWFGSGTDHNVAKGNDISFNRYGVLVERGADHNDFDNNRFRGNCVDVEHR